MADFCMGCSEDLFGKDFGDMAGITTEQETNEGIYARVLCEGCGGMILVDHTGKKVVPQTTEKQNDTTNDQVA